MTELRSEASWAQHLSLIQHQSLIHYAVLLLVSLSVWSVVSDSLRPHGLDPGIEPVHLASLALADKFFTTAPPGKSCLDIELFVYYLFWLTCLY